MDLLVANWEYLLAAWTLITGALVILLVYRGTLSTHENDELLLENEERRMMVGEQRSVVRKMHRLQPVILICASLSIVLLLTGYVTWVWTIVRAR